VFADVKAVLFDLGDTLVSYPLPSWPTSVAQGIDAVYGFLVRPGRDQLPPAAHLPAPGEAHARRGRPPAGAAPLHRAAIGLRRIVRAASGFTLPHIAEAFTRPLLARGKVYPEAPAALRTLRDRGYRLALVSNTPWGTPDYLWERQIERFGLADLIPVRLYSSGVGFRKPDPRLFRLALGRLGVRPRQALFVGDSLRDDVAGAQGAGVWAALVRRRARPPGPTCAAPDLTIAGLDELLPYLTGPASSENPSCPPPPRPL